MYVQYYVQTHRSLNEVHTAQVAAYSQRRLSSRKQTGIGPVVRVSIICWVIENGVNIDVSGISEVLEIVVNYTSLSCNA